MSPLILLILLPFIGGLVALIDGRSRIRSALWALAGLLGGLAAACRPVYFVLGTGTPFVLHLPWAMAGGNFQLMLDPLSAFFLLPVVILYLPGCPPHPMTILEGLLQLVGIAPRDLSKE